MAVTAPLGSSMSSSVVVTVYVAVVPFTVIVGAPVAPKLPVWDTCTFTVIGVVGAGLDDMVNDAVPPSVILLPPLIVISGVGVGGCTGTGVGVGGCCCCCGTGGESSSTITTFHCLSPPAMCLDVEVRSPVYVSSFRKPTYKRLTLSPRHSTFSMVSPLCTNTSSFQVLWPLPPGFGRSRQTYLPFSGMVIVRIPFDSDMVRGVSVRLGLLPVLVGWHVYVYDAGTGAGSSLSDTVIVAVLDVPIV